MLKLQLGNHYRLPTGGYVLVQSKYRADGWALWALVGEDDMRLLARDDLRPEDFRPTVSRHIVECWQDVLAIWLIEGADAAALEMLELHGAPVAPQIERMLAEVSGNLTITVERKSSRTIC